MQKISFDDTKARTYRKRQQVLAFRSDDPINFHKSWGEQEIRAAGWIIVPLAVSGKPTGDLYGCDAGAFADTYEPSPSLKPNHYRKKETVRAYQPGEAFEVNTRLPDGFVEVSGSRSGSPDAWIVKAPGGELYPVEDVVFRRSYVEVIARRASYRVKSRDEHWAEDGGPKRILSLDGGGIRGVLSLEYLQRIENILQERHGGSDRFRLSHYFDLIAGTSTGAIIAACLAKGMRVEEIKDLYATFGEEVFKVSVKKPKYFRVRYDEKNLKKFLEEQFHGDKLGSESLRTGLLITTKRLDTGSVWPLANNPHDRFFSSGSDADFLANKEYLLSAVVRASTAAPIFFKPEEIVIARKGKNKSKGVFIDGGVSPHNNPSLLALQLVTFDGFGLNWQLDPDKLLLVSVGTGRISSGTSSSKQPTYHAFKSLLSLMEDCGELVETMMQWLSSSPTARHIDLAIQDLGSDLLAGRPLLQYMRYNVQFSKEWLKAHLDMDVDRATVETLHEIDKPSNIPLLSDIGKNAARIQVDPDHFPRHFDLG